MEVVHRLVCLSKDLKHIKLEPKKTLNLELKTKKVLNLEGVIINIISASHLFDL